MLKMSLREICRTCKHSEIITSECEDYYSNDTLAYTCDYCVSNYLDGTCERYEPIDSRELFENKATPNNIVHLNMPLSSVIISLDINIDYRVIKEYVEEHFSNSKDSLFVFLFQQCGVYKGRDIDKVLWGHFKVRSVEEFQSIIDNNRNEFKDHNVPEYLVDMVEEIGKIHYKANCLEEQIVEQLEMEMQEQYEKDMEEYEFEQWRREKFTSDGDIIEED